MEVVAMNRWLDPGLTVTFALCFLTCSGNGADRNDGGPPAETAAADSGADVGPGYEATTPDLRTDHPAGPDGPAPGTDARADEKSPDEVLPDDLTSPDDIPAEEAVEPDEKSSKADLALLGPAQWQRGPVTLMLVLDPGTEGPFDCSVEYSMNGNGWTPATSMAGFGDDLVGVPGGTRRFVWDSMADTEDESDAVLRSTCTAQDTVLLAESAGFPLRNAPGRDRVVLITSAINGNNKVRRLDFAHGEGLSYDGKVYEVGSAPVDVAFHPGGVSAATLNQEAETITFFAVAEQGDAEMATTISSTGLNFEKARFAHDGSGLYLLNYDSTPKAGMYRLELDPHSGLPAGGASPVLLSPHFTGQAFDLLPANGGYAVLAGIQGLEGLELELRTAEGATLADLEFAPEGSLARALAVSPYGDLILTAHANLFGETEAVVLFTLDDNFQVELMGQVEVVDPDDLEFAGDGISAVVSEAWENRATLVRVGGGIALSDLGSVKVDLATSIASPAVGPDAGRFFVATVSATTGESGLTEIFVDGNTLVKEEFFSLGNGNDVIPRAVAIQP